MFIVAPSGIVNDEISRGTPKASHEDRVNGIVAFELADEKANV